MEAREEANLRVLRWRVDIDECDLVSLEELECLRELLINYPVAIPKFDGQPIIARGSYNLVELIQAMFARGERRGKLEKQGAQFAVTAQGIDGSQKHAGYRFFYFWRQLHPPLHPDESPHAYP